MKFFALIIASLVVFSSCAGYKMGGVKPASLARVKTVVIPMFKNSTLHSRAEALGTSAVINAMVQDGTYQVASIDHADAILEGTINDISYSTLRGTRLDSLRPEELVSEIWIGWTLKDARDPTKVLASGVASGSSQLFVSANLQTARNNALPEAMDRAAESLVSQISNGY